MMDTRRDFLKKAALLSSGAGLLGVLPPSIQKALAIDPQPGSTYLDAEHVVLLMQENRAFDHCYGTLQGVRGFNDPRAITLPNRNRVWLQTNAAGKTYAPFRLDIKDTKITWMSALPHSWENQVDARNNGRYDRWLDVKRSGNKQYADMPLTMGYYTREDIPFYYSLADAFTVCDQNFCSSLTGTTPNRLYWWSGTIREQQNGTSPANVRNSEVDYDREAHWRTFPERLEDNGISWKVYQNEISLPTGLAGEAEAWLANFTDNPLEWFSQYRVRHSAAYHQYLEQREAALKSEIPALEQQLASAATANNATLAKQLQEKKDALEKIAADRKQWSRDKFEQLSRRDKNLHEKAFCTNSKDPDYHSLTTLQYRDGNTERTMQVPKGDVLHQFRADVKSGQLPTVSWIVAPENYSDHPGAPWYGAWYVSEVLDILTQNPEVWKKTIFVLAYDENDGSFDHVPPFVPPHKPGTGRVSKSIDTSVEYVTREQELAKGVPEEDIRESPIGLGYRVPLVIASPWSRGGWVCSEVFDHTSILQFMEKWLGHKTGKKITETNISEWRRTVCGDLTSVFRPWNGEKIATPVFVDKTPFLESVHKAQFMQPPSDFRALGNEEIAQLNSDPFSSPYMPQQEQGKRASCALPYELYADGQLDRDKQTFRITFAAGNKVFGKTAAGAPFNVYAPGVYEGEAVRAWSYALTAGDHLADSWPLQAFEGRQYHLRVYGPNGFYREFTGNGQDPQLNIACEYERSGRGLTGNVVLKLHNHGSRLYKVSIKDNAYGAGPRSHELRAGETASLVLDLAPSYSWYDLSVLVEGETAFEKRYAGRVETGRPGFSDPAMGREVLTRP